MVKARWLVSVRMTPTTSEIPTNGSVSFSRLGLPLRSHAPRPAAAAVAARRPGEPAGPAGDPPGGVQDVGAHEERDLGSGQREHRRRREPEQALATLRTESAAQSLREVPP